MQLETSKMATVRVVQSEMPGFSWMFHPSSSSFRGKNCALVLAAQDCGRVGVPADFLLTRWKAVSPQRPRRGQNAEISTVDGWMEDPNAMDAMRWAHETSRAESSEKALKLGRRNFRKKRQAPFWGLFLCRGLKTEYLDFMRKQNATIVWSWDMLTSSCPCFLPAVDLLGFASPGCFLLEQLFSRPFSKERGHRGPDVCKCLGAGVKLGELPNHRAHQFFKSHIIA